MLSTSDKVVAYRHREGWSQDKIAEVLGVSRQTIVAREQGDSWKVSELVELAKAFGCQVSDLVGG